MGTRSSDARSVTEHFDLYASGETWAGGKVKRLDIENIRKDALAATRTTVVSAYYGVGTLENLLGACRGEVRVILNGLGGSRLKTQVAELEELQAGLGGRFVDVEIRLGFADGVFHPKLYLFESVRGSVGWLGSANATSAGLSGRNQEILARVVGVPPAIMEYVERTWARALQIEECKAPVNSLTAFFRTGVLYYKPYALLQKTFNPFRRLMTSLPIEERVKITAFSSDYAEAEVGIGAFSIDRVLARDPEGGSPAEPERDLRQGQTDYPNSERLLFRQYAVETCYGYWVSEKFVETVDSMLERASWSKSAELRHLREWLSRREEFIVGAYETYLSTAKATMDARGVAWSGYADPRLFVDTEPVHKHLASLLHKLSDEKRFKRYCQAYVGSEVPEFWEDETAREAFESSFFDWLAAFSSGGRRPKAALTILDAIGAYDEEAETIRERLEDLLARPGWYENEFLRSES